ncbi:hypothetical protein QES_1164 [Clostridioides difficile CD149]|uniref:hypothetical protein n=1 Tax=Clostridioides difficile TaxID=1496 RepID=UPI00016C5E89|nr:hypothetical protein [Clostridioides difficile]EJA6611922.1 hypothetical protein [Clostridioides difficile]EJA6639027.1 hypothetical protein [Clostridioides difficile]EJA6646669.1 hypothetical protein [Clostridioides difficile]EJA6650654.1 hypothetical protein [Clostridioides difficile]EJA6752420.1 hypothetical protein [Clostridioides difficile]
MVDLKIKSLNEIDSKENKIKIINTVTEIREKDYNTFLKIMGYMEYSKLKNKAQ